MPTNQPTILISYNYFAPGYRAGGPIQSLVNLVATLGEKYRFFVLTTVYDLGTSEPYSNIATDCWIQTDIGGHPVSIWYASNTSIPFSVIKQLVCEVNPNFVYINGIYSPAFFLYPLLAAKQLGIKAIISPRGMLQAGALSIKPLKKIPYLFALKLSRLLKNVAWHATNKEEETDIRAYYGLRAIVQVAENIPKHPIAVITNTTKNSNELNLVFLSLIAEKKNLTLLLQVLQQCNQTIRLAIYGPITDAGYWQTCCSLIAQMPEHITVQYCGDIAPYLVQEKLQQYDALVLLTKGENFGHALYESLSVGRPIITSYFTPWNNLEEQQAGWNVDIAQTTASIAAEIDALAAKDAVTWQLFCQGAHKMAATYYNNGNFEKAYAQLFNKA